MGTCLDTPSLLGNHFTYCKTMNKMTFLPMLLLLSVSLSVANNEVCGPAHCEMNCGSGEICKDKKLICEEKPSLGKKDECCKGYSCTTDKNVNNDQPGKTKNAPGAGSNPAAVTGVVVMLSAWAVAMR